jgi:hypothetical protein
MQNKGTLKDFHVLLPGTCEYRKVCLPWQKQFCVCDEGLRVWEKEILYYPGGPNVITQVSEIKELFWLWSGRDGMTEGSEWCFIAGFADGEGVTSQGMWIASGSSERQGNKYSTGLHEKKYRSSQLHSGVCLYFQLFRSTRQEDLLSPGTQDQPG